MKEDARYDELAELFKVFADSSRIAVLYALLDNERCVNDLADALSMTQSAVSHQLKILKLNKLVRSRRDGKQVFYSPADDHVSTILSMGMEHVLEEK